MEASQRLEEQQESLGAMENNKSGSTQMSKKKGGWITFPFIIGTVMGLSLAGGGWYANITVYAIEKYNMNPIPAAQIHNIAGGGLNFFPIVGAILADTFFGPYRVVLVAAFVSLLGGIMFTLSAALPHLRPPSCNPSSQACQSATNGQYAFLYITLALAMIGLGGARYVLGTVGANQYDKKKHQSVYFNWFMFTFEVSWVIAFTVIVYVQDNVSWAVGFGINAVASAVAMALFFSGSRFYRRVMPQGSPFTSIARVFVASLRKATLLVEDHDEYFYENTESKNQHEAPSSSLRFINRAAVLPKEGTHAAQSSLEAFEKSWILCTVEEVEDVKKLMKALTIWCAGLLESTIYAVSSSIITIQALVMDRQLGPNFQIPAGSVFVFTLIFAALFLAILDRFLFPMWKKVFGWPLTPLQRIGVGYFFNMLGMFAYGIIEHKRLGLIQTYNLLDQARAVAPMSVMWLVIPLALLGAGSAFYLPGEIELYYQEFPRSLRTTSTSMTSLRLAVGYYLSTAIVAIVENTTSWLPNDINRGRVDKVYWLVSILGLVNFVIYLTVSKLYKYNSYDPKDETDDHASED